MRRRLAVALIAAAAAAPWLWFYPEPPAADQVARLVAVLDIPATEDWMGGFSGFDLTQDGISFHAVTDRGHRVQGSVLRDGATPVGIVFDRVQPLVNHAREEWESPGNDAEGVALDRSGRVFVSFEHAHRVFVYDDWDAPARWPSYTRAWRALSNNRGLEALAVAEDGTLYAIPEQINPGATEALVYRRLPGADWNQAFTVPVDSDFAPVGADIGPDGRFYLLERGVYPFGFYSRVRSMTITEDGFDDIETVLQTRLGTHGNLEGLAVWRAEDGALRLTMVSDDNFKWFMRGQLVEYMLAAGLAKTAQ